MWAGGMDLHRTTGCSIDGGSEGSVWRDGFLKQEIRTVHDGDWEQDVHPELEHLKIGIPQILHRTTGNSHPAQHCRLGGLYIPI